MTKESLKVGDFQIGDRVAAYWYDGRFTGTVIELTKLGVRIKFDSGLERRCHPKQLRRLKPKKKPMRVECKVEWHEVEMGYCVPFMADRAEFPDLVGKRGTLTFVEEVKNG